MTLHPVKDIVKKRWELDRARGMGRTYVDARLVRDRIAEHAAQGWTHVAVGRAAGVTANGVRWIADGKSARTRADIAARILAVTPRALYAAAGPHDCVPSVGYLRRARALATVGYTIRYLIAYGITIKPAAKWVTAAQWREMCEFYDAHWDVPGPSRLSVTRSLARGWAPPLAWDDDTIDDPTATPHLWMPSRTTGRSPGAFIEDVEWLVSAGEGMAGAARRLGVKPESLPDMLRQRGRQDLTRRLRLADEAEAS